MSPPREPLADALRMQRAAARKGFDWEKTADLWDKLHEEIAELQGAVGDPAAVREEIGDLLFMLVNLARHLGADPARALAGANRKFRSRFAFIWRHRAALPPLGDSQRLWAMEALWQQAKRLERVLKAPRTGRGARSSPPSRRGSRPRR